MNIVRKTAWLTILIVIVGFVYFLGHILTPFLIAALLAYISNPLVNHLIELKLPRIWAATIIFLILLLILSLLLLLLIPQLVEQVNLFITSLPRMFAWLQFTALAWTQKYLGVTVSLNFDDIKALVIQHWQQAGGAASIVLRTVSQSGFALFTIILNLLLIPVVTFYLLRDWPLLLARIHSLIPHRSQAKVGKVALECDAVLGAFFRGQLLVMLSLAIIYFIGLKIVGLDLALLIAAIAGLVSIVPYLGFILGITTASIAAAVQFHDVTHVFYVLLVFLVGQVSDGMFLTPKLVGDRIGLHPVAVIFAVLAGGELFGFVGVLLALPVTAVLRVLLGHSRQWYLSSSFYKA